MALNDMPQKRRFGMCAIDVPEERLDLYPLIFATCIYSLIWHV